MDIFLPLPDHQTKIQKDLLEVPWPSSDAQTPTALLARCPAASVTPLTASQALAEISGVSSFHVKDERARMGLGSFKALGAAYVIATDAEMGEARGQTYVTASAGNHGLSVAAGASAFGAKAVIFLAETVPESFAERLRSIGAEVRRHGAIYEEAMQGAAETATAEGWVLLSDSAWPGYVTRPHTLMEGYLVLMQEAADEMPQPPTHIFLQAGVGGLAAACAAYARKVWGPDPKIIVVEPEFAPALFVSMQKGSAQITSGPESDMGRLDCKEPSIIALKGLARDADAFMTISEDEGALGRDVAAKAGMPSTTSGAAGIAGLLAIPQSQRAKLGLDEASRILTILSEEAAT